LYRSTTSDTALVINTAARTAQGLHAAQNQTGKQASRQSCHRCIAATANQLLHMFFCHQHAIGNVLRTNQALACPLGSST
jgi:hypothetical protein